MPVFGWDEGHGQRMVEWELAEDAELMREFHMQGDELDDVELDAELEELEGKGDIEVYNDLDLEELDETRYRLELALERVKAAIKQRRSDGE